MASVEASISYLNYKKFEDKAGKEFYETALQALSNRMSLSRMVKMGRYYCPVCGTEINYQGFCYACGKHVY